MNRTLAVVCALTFFSGSGACLMLDSSHQHVPSTETVHIDLGHVSAEEPIRHEIRIQNRSHDRLTIKQVTSDCGCVAWELDRYEIDSGAHATLSLALPATRPGTRFESAIGIRGRHGDTPHVISLLLRGQGRQEAPPPDDDETAPADLDFSTDLLRRWAEAEAMRAKAADDLIAWVEQGRKESPAPLLLPAVSEADYARMPEADRLAITNRIFHDTRHIIRMAEYILDLGDVAIRMGDHDRAVRLYEIVRDLGSIHADPKRNTVLSQRLGLGLVIRALSRLTEFHEEAGNLEDATRVRASLEASHATLQSLLRPR